jgi:hypothetical protein
MGTSTSSSKRGMDATETIIAGESSEEMAAQQLDRIKNANNECNEIPIQALPPPLSMMQ